MAGYDHEKIKQKLESALKEYGELPEETCRDIVFHMTDWFGDFEELSDFYRNPDKYSADEVVELLIKFLVHVPEHVAAANKLMTGFGIVDVFKVDVIKDDEDLT